MCRMSLLRSSEELTAGFYKHLAPTELRSKRFVFRVCQQYPKPKRSKRFAPPIDSLDPLEQVFKSPV
jgi:hypothetical protein